jgi:hypothetical protein
LQTPFLSAEQDAIQRLTALRLEHIKTEPGEGKDSKAAVDSKVDVKVDMAPEDDQVRGCDALFCFSCATRCRMV